MTTIKISKRLLPLLSVATIALTMSGCKKNKLNLDNITLSINPVSNLSSQEATNEEYDTNINCENNNIDVKTKVFKKEI